MCCVWTGVSRATRPFSSSRPMRRECPSSAAPSMRRSRERPRSPPWAPASGDPPPRSPTGSRSGNGPSPPETRNGGTDRTRSGASSLSARSPSEASYDVAIVGAGDVGSAIARELSRFELRLALIEAGSDVGAGTSKANTAILHTGFDAKPGTIESRLVARGYELLGAYASEVGIPKATVGALMVAWNREQRDALAGIEAKARENGYGYARPVDADELYRREPDLGPGAQGGLEVPGEGIVCPFTTTLALATEALGGGCSVVLNA